MAFKTIIGPIKITDRPGKIEWFKLVELKMSKKKDVVIRISEENHIRLKRLMETRTNSKGKKPTTNQLLDSMLLSLENVENGKMVYLVDDKCFYEVSDARGEAIVRSVKNKKPVTMPMVAVIVGKDEI